YTYDNLNQLTRENNQKLGKTYVYTYSNGNITNRKEYAYTTGTPGTAIKTDTWTYGDTSWGDVLTAYNGVATSINKGRITALNGKSLSYDYIGLLSAAGSTSFTYDTSGRRLSKTTGGVNIGVVNPIRYKDYYYDTKIRCMAINPFMNHI
ncbi:MAG: hypothetical protein IKL47_08535, partial [Clostridia bacterium]|nr:hypothetical protein [Clostridia bacterium]